MARLPRVFRVLWRNRLPQVKSSKLIFHLCLSDTTHLCMDAQESNQHISRILYQVLKDTGVTMETRKLMTERCISKESLTHWKFLNFNGSNMYVCGSTYEGTTTVGLESFTFCCIHSHNMKKSQCNFSERIIFKCELNAQYDLITKTSRNGNFVLLLLF